MWLFSLLLIKIAPMWYHTIITVSDTQVMRNLNEIMVEVRLQHHVSEWQQAFIKGCNTLVDSRKQETITKVLFQQQKQELLQRTFRSINHVYRQAFYNAAIVLSRRKINLTYGDSYSLVNKFYHWNELNKIKRSNEVLGSFLIAIKRTGSFALVDNGDLPRILDIHDRTFFRIDELDNIAGPLARTESSDLSNINLSELGSSHLVDVVYLVNEIISTIPGLIW